VCFVVECILLDDGLRNGCQGNSHVLFAHNGCSGIENFKVESGKAGAGGRNELFSSSFTVERSAVGC
jgi:hypothetical protein